MLTSQQITEVKNIAIGFPFYLHNGILEKHFWKNEINYSDVFIIGPETINIHKAKSWVIPRG